MALDRNNEYGLSFLNILEPDPEEEKKPEPNRFQQFAKKASPFVVYAVLVAHFAYATKYFIDKDFPLRYTCCDGYGFLIILFCFITYGMLYAYLISPYLKKPLSRFVFKPIKAGFSKIFELKFAKWLTYLIILALILAFLIWDAWGNYERLIPLAGLLLFITFGFVCSKHRKHIKWDTIIRGLILQFCFGVITLRWETGRRIFQCAGDKVTIFLEYAKNGAAFVYGEELVMIKKVFAFEAISTIYFLAFMINILYYLGIMQKIVVNLGMFLQGIMGTSVLESVNSAANIFLGQTEAPLMLKPYLHLLTASELHSVMTAGFASVSGTVLAAYISYGANAAHLITASVMAAPAGLVYSKLMYPETEETMNPKENLTLTGSEYSSVLDAASQGAMQATQIIMAIISNLIAFIACVYFINGVLGWFGDLVGLELTVELIVGYIFTPISYLMGVRWDECRGVGKLIGLKMMVNEFAAFEQLEPTNLSERSKVIATFAICGFANPGSIGIVISGLGTLIPSKSPVITATAFRAFVSGSIVCFTTACIAGMLTV